MEIDRKQIEIIKSLALVRFVDTKHDSFLKVIYFVDEK